MIHVLGHLSKSLASATEYLKHDRRTLSVGVLIVDRSILDGSVPAFSFFKFIDKKRMRSSRWNLSTTVNEYSDWYL
jgi:hypothetical protein